MNFNIGQLVKTITELPGGMNNKLYKLETEEGEELLLKKYIRDDRHRLDREFTSFSILHNLGFNVPKPIQRNDDEYWGAYEFIHGQNKKPEEITKTDISSLVDFLVELHQIHPVNIKEKVRPAFFNTLRIGDYLKSIQKRYDQFLSEESEGISNPLVSQAARDMDWEGLIKNIHQDAKSRFSSEFLERELPSDQWVISPVDFGIHNTIFRPDNQITVIDFEYSGWDDPVGILVEFINHAANKGMLQERFDQFINEYWQKAQPDPEFEKRFEASKWLNGQEWIAIFIFAMTQKKINDRRHGMIDFDEDKYVKSMLKKLEDKITSVAF